MFHGLRTKTGHGQRGDFAGIGKILQINIKIKKTKVHSDMKSSRNVGEKWTAQSVKDGVSKNGKNMV